MNIARFLKQRVQWEPLTGLNSSSEPVLGPAVTVVCRKRAKLRDIIAKDGETITTTTTVMMIEEPAIGDHLDGRQVVAVEQGVDMTGATVGWIALTR